MECKITFVSNIQHPFAAPSQMTEDMTYFMLIDAENLSFYVYGQLEVWITLPFKSLGSVRL